jgi:hypothetical protein
MPRLNVRLPASPASATTTAAHDQPTAVLAPATGGVGTVKEFVVAMLTKDHLLKTRQHRRGQHLLFRLRQQEERGYGIGMIPDRCAIILAYGLCDVVRVLPAL